MKYDGGVVTSLRSLVLCELYDRTLTSRTRYVHIYMNFTSLTRHRLRDQSLAVSSTTLEVIDKMSLIARPYVCYN